MPASSTVSYGEGWFAEDLAEYFPSRWMGREARLVVPAGMWTGRRFASLPVWSGAGDGGRTLSVASGTGPPVHLDLLEGWHVYDFALPTPVSTAGDLDLTLRVVAVVVVVGATQASPLPNAPLPNAPLPDSRPSDATVRVGRIEFHDDLKRHERAEAFNRASRAMAESGSLPGRVASDGPEPSPAGTTGGYLPRGGDGWHEWEFQNYMPFRWMRLHARIAIPEEVHGGRGLCTVPISSEFHDLSQVLTVSVGGGSPVELPLARYWTYYTFEVPPPRPGDLTIAFALNKLLPMAYHPGDSRDLGARFGPFEFHDDRVRAARHARSYENAVLNRREIEAGATVLASSPLSLGIDLWGKCNIKPPCAYCWWDHAKSLEGADVNAVVDDTTLMEYGPFFDAARTFVNCSFGEPLLHPRLAETASLVATHDKVLELATNGQAFTPATVAALAGRPVLLYVSLDAASPEVYARLRNDRWHDVIAGLLHLRDARRLANRLPAVRMVFMPMRANLQDLEAYFNLALMVEAEAVVLRPLNYAEHTRIASERGGYLFDYDRELLTREEIDQVCRRSEEYAARRRLWLINQFNFGS